MSQEQVSSNTKGGSLKWLLIILLIVVILGGGYLLYAKYGKKSSVATYTTSPTTTTSTPTTTTTDKTAGWKTYTSNELGLTFKYPSSWGEPEILSYDYTTNNKDKDIFNGKYYQVGFKNGGNVTGYTSDFRALEVNAYIGDITNLDIPEVIEITKMQNSDDLHFIKKTTIADQKTYFEGRLFYAPEASGIDVETVAYLNGQKDYKGVEISYNYKTMTDRLLKYYNATDNPGLEENSKNELKGLEDGTLNDKTALSQYQEYQTWLSTFQFTK